MEEKAKGLEMSESDKQPETKVGRPKKRDRAVVQISEALGTVLDAEVLSVADMEGFPQLQNESPKNQMIMCGVACGISQQFIANAFGLAKSSVSKVVNRIDPHGMFKVSKEAKKAFMTQLYESRGMEALMSITAEKLEDSDANQLASIAKKMTDAAQSLNQSKHKELETTKLDQMLSNALAEIGEAEVIEEK